MSYTVCQADLEKDKKVILDFWSYNHKNTLNKKFKWIYEENPDGQAMVWLIKHQESGEYVGITSVFPRKFFINHKWVNGGIIGDFLIIKKHRTLGPAIMLQQKALSALDSNIDFIYGFPNKPSQPVLKRVGYKSLGPITRLVKIIKIEPQLRKLGINKFLITLVAPLINSSLKLLSLETWHHADPVFFCEEVNEIDQRFDLLWNKNKDMYPIIGGRTASFLRWKYLEDPDDSNKVFAIFDLKKSSLKGYIIYSVNNNSVEILDILFSDSKNVMNELMICFLRHIKKFSPESLIITFLAKNKTSRMMKKFGFIRGKCQQNVYIYCSKKLTSSVDLLNGPRNWMLMHSEQDT